MSILKKYLICTLIILLCFSCIIPVAFAKDQEVIIISQPSEPNVILILNPDGTIRERIYFSSNHTYNIPIETEEYKEEDITESDSEPIVETPEETIDSLANEIFELVNKEREAANLNKLEYNFELQSAANLRAKEASESFSHTRPNGETCYTAFNVNYNVAGENLIVADKEIADAANLVKTWMESEGHRANILLPEFTSIAIGVYIKDNSVYASQLFIG